MSEAQAIGIDPVNIIADGISAGDFLSPARGDYKPDLKHLDPALRAKVEKSLTDFDPSKVRD